MSDEPIDLDRQLEQAIADHRRPGMTAGDLAPLLPEDLQRQYWARKVDEYFASEGIK